MNLVAHSHYKRVPNYRDLNWNEWDLLEKGLNDRHLYSEEEAFGRLQEHISKYGRMLRMQAERYFPHEYMYKLLFLSGVLEQ
jgi:deoxyhypusine synthase